MWQGTSGNTHRFRRGMRKDCTKKIAQFRLSPLLMHQFPFPSFSCLRIYEGDLLPTGMEITTYNHHLKAPSFPVVFVVKQRILCWSGPSLLSNQSFAESALLIFALGAKGGVF